jgi:hypothetical protein
MSKGNVTQNLTPAASGAIERFDPRRATEFAQKSTSEETRRAYSSVVREFFAAIGNLDPRLVGPAQVVRPIKTWVSHLANQLALSGSW